MGEYIEFLAIGIITGSSEDKLDLKVLIGEEIDISTAVYPKDSCLIGDTHVLVKCFTYPGEENSSFCCAVVKLLEPSHFTRWVIPTAEKNVLCDAKANKYVVSANVYDYASNYICGFLDMQVEGLPGKFDIPLYLPINTEFSPCSADTTIAMDVITEILKGQADSVKEYQDSMHIIESIMKRIHEKRRESGEE